MEALIRHATYVVTVTITATIIAVAVGVLVRRRPVAREVALGTTSVFITIPSLALFTLFIPVLGLGFAPSFVALLLYALLPIMRNTVTGLNSVCLLYTSDAADDLLCVDLGGRRILKKKN